MQVLRRFESGRQHQWVSPAQKIPGGRERGTMKPFDYDSARWKHKRAVILRRDGYRCQICKRYGRAREATEVHHIKHADEFPELAYDNGNLVSLCHACHNAQHPEKAPRRGRY